MQETNMIECRKISKQYFPTQFVRVIGDTAALPGTMTPTACLETFNESIRKNKVWLEEGSRDAISMQTECVSAEGVDPWPRPEWCMVLVSAANRLIGEVVQSRRRPLLGPSPG